MPLGIILFEQGSVTSGLACARTVCTPFVEIEELIRFSDVVWWTNLNDMQLRSIKRRHPDVVLKSETYIRPGLSKIVDCWGLNGLDNATMLLTLANIFAPLAMVEDLVEKPHGRSTLVASLASLYPAPDFVEGDLNHALNNAFLEWTDVYPVNPARLRSFTARVNGAVHYESFHGVNIPSADGWVHYGPSNLASDQVARRNMLLDLGKPFLARISLEDRTSLLARVFGFASSTPRSWVTDAELRFLTQFVPVNIVEAFVGEGYTDNPTAASPELRSDEARDSWLAGLLSELFFVAASGREKLYAPTSRSFLRASLRGVWMRSAERIAMAKKCMSIACDDITIEAVGPGAVRMGVTNPRKAYPLLRDAGLLPSMQFLNDHPAPNGERKGTCSLDALWSDHTVHDRLKALILLNYIPWLSGEGQMALRARAAAIVQGAA